MKKVISVLLIIVVLLSLCSLSVSAYNPNFYIDITLTEKATDLVKEGKYQYTVESFPDYELYEVSCKSKNYESCFELRLIFTHDDYMNVEEIGKELLKREDVLYVNTMSGFSFNPELKNIRCYLTYETICDFIDGKLNYTSRSFPEVNAFGVKAGRELTTDRYYLDITVGVYEDSEYNEFKEILKNRDEFISTTSDYLSSDISLFIGESKKIDFSTEYKWNSSNTDIIDFNKGEIVALKEGKAKLTKEDSDGNIYTFNIYVYDKIDVTDNDIIIDVNLKIGETVKLPQWYEYKHRRAWNVYGQYFEIISTTESSSSGGIVRTTNNNLIRGGSYGTVKGNSEGSAKYFGVNERGQRVIYNITVEKCQHENTIIKHQEAKSYFKKGYTGDTVCSTCGEIIQTGTDTKKLKLKTPTVKRLTGGKKKIVVRYSKVKDATGYQIKYKLGKKAVTKTYNKKTITTKFLSVKKKGTYKVYVRAFAKQGKSKAYSSWTKAKKVKVK